MKTVYEILGIHKSRDKTTENVDNSADKGTSCLLYTSDAADD